MDAEDTAGGAGGVDERAEDVEDGWVAERSTDRAQGGESRVEQLRKEEDERGGGEQGADDRRREGEEWNAEGEEQVCGSGSGRRCFRSMLCEA